MKIQDQDISEIPIIQIKHYNSLKTPITLVQMRQKKIIGNTKTMLSFLFRFLRQQQDIERQRKGTRSIR